MRLLPEVWRDVGHGLARFHRAAALVVFVALVVAPVSWASADTPTPTSTPQETPTATPQGTPTATPTPGPTVTGTPSATATPTVAPTATTTPSTTATVRGLAFYDDNGNGLQDSGEVVAAGASLTATCASCSGTPQVATSTVAANGGYSLSIPVSSGTQEYTISATASRTGGPSVASGPNYSGSTLVMLAGGQTLMQNVGLVPHDARYFSQTGYRIDNDTIWNYFNRRGGLVTFGYPTSRTFTFQGFTVQFFQRRIIQLGPNGQARLINLLDPGLLPYTSFNGSTFPGVDGALVSTAPDPTNQPATLAWVAQHAPNTVGSAPTNYYTTFTSTVSAQVAFPNGGDASLLPGIDLELWGVPTSGALVDPNNHNFIALRWQRGIMMYDASCTCTQGILLADYLKDVITGQNLPADLTQEAAGSPFMKQYDPTQPNWVHNQSLLPDTNFTLAFLPE